MSPSYQNQSAGNKQWPGRGVAVGVGGVVVVVVVELYTGAVCIYFQAEECSQGRRPAAGISRIRHRSSLLIRRWI